MTTFEKCKQIRRMLVNRAAEVMAYKNWKDDFVIRQIRDFPQEFFDIQPSDLTEAEMRDLGFLKWSSDTSLMLIPLWLFPFIADEMEVEGIDGERKIMKKSKMDMDNRFGCIAYGVLPKLKAD
jgi:hypothetical protein